MAAMTFDTLKFANTLKAAGVPDKQAEAEATAFAEVLQINFKELATKDDLALLAKDLRREMADIRRELAEMREEFKRDIADLREEMKQEFRTVRQEVKDESQKTNARMDTFQANTQGEFLLLRWMLGVVITIGVGILIRLFLFPFPR